MNAPDYATLPELVDWAYGVMDHRDPDFVIGGNYLTRWWVMPRNAFTNVYLHRFGRSDDDRAMHDHPWDNASYILHGEYLEHTPAGIFHRKPGDYVARPATALHRVELIDGAPVVSLFTTGPKVREWGFACPKGWVHWRDFTAPGNSSEIGAGCGEFA